MIPDLPLGAHKTPMRPDAPLAPADLAGLVGEIVAALGLDGVTPLVGNNSGGAISQLAAAERPPWLARLVLTPCDMYENFPPTLFKAPPSARGPRARVAPRVSNRCASARCVTRRCLAGWLTKRGVDDALLST